MVKGDAERVRDAFVELCEPMHDVFAWAEQIRRKRLREMFGKREYDWLATHTVRGFAHLELAKRQKKKKLGPWRLFGQHGRNGELWLTDGDYRARVLHTLSPSQVPPAGHNKQRRAFYRNPPLITLPKLFGPPRDQLLILWRIDADGAPAFRVVRPIGNWKFGQTAQADLDFTLAPSAEDLAELVFEPSEEGLELAIPDEREEEDGAGGVSG